MRLERGSDPNSESFPELIGDIYGWFTLLQQILDKSVREKITSKSAGLGMAEEDFHTVRDKIDRYCAEVRYQVLQYEEICGENVEKLAELYPWYQLIRFCGLLGHW